jgi:hypothetical protein
MPIWQLLIILQEVKFYVVYQIYLVPMPYAVTSFIFIYGKLTEFHCT